MKKKIHRIEIRTQTQGEDKYLNELSVFDHSGNPTLQEEYSVEGEVESRIESKYDDEGRLIEQKQLIENGELADHKVFTRDDSGKIIRTEIYFQGGSKSIQTNIYDPEEKTLELLEVDEDGELETKEVSHLNEEKLVLLKEIYNYEDKLTEAFRYSYDQHGNMIRRDQLDHRKKLIIYTEYEYDDSKRVVIRASRNRKGKLSDFLKIDYDEITKTWIASLVRSSIYWYTRHKKCCK